MRQADEGRLHFHNSTRFLVLLLSTACLTFCVANPLVLNFTVICMDDVVLEYRRHFGNETLLDEEIHWLEDSFRRNLLFSAVAVGNLLGTLPITHIIQHCGTRNLFLVYCLLSALSTALFPLAVSLNIYAFIFFVRLLQGFGQSFTMPACGSVCASWSSLKECGLYMAVLSMHLQFSSIFTMPVSSAFCVSPIGWRGVFYLQAMLTVACSVLFHFFYHDSPSMHKNVSGKELSRLSLGKEGEDSRRAVPYSSIIRTPVIISIWCSSFGGNLGFMLLQQFGAIYLNKVLHLEVTSTGLATALPFILSALLKLVAGPLSDHAACLSEKCRILLFASLSQGFMAVCYVLLAMTSTPWLSQTAYTAVIVFSGLNVIGTMRCAQLVARQFMPFVMSVVNIITCIVNLVLPALIARLAVSDSPSQWSLVFCGVAGAIVLSNIYFLFVATADAAEWTRSEVQEKKDLP